jgi:hypothetical protein
VLADQINSTGGANDVNAMTRLPRIRFGTAAEGLEKEIV